MRPVLASVAVMALAACGPQLTIVGNGDVTTVDRPVEGTKAVKLAVPGSLLVELGGTPSLQLKGEGNLLTYIQTTVSSGELEIGVAPGVALSPTEPMRFVLTVPSLRGLSTVSPGSITAPALSAPDFKLRVASSGNIHVARIDATNLDVEIVSSGDIQVDEGQVKDQSISIKSSGSVFTDGMQSTTTNARLSSSGDAWVWATDRLIVTLTSSGSVHYAGAPRVTSNLSSSGTVQPIGE